MPKIEVLQPFGLRLDSKSERRSFAKGIHKVSEAELKHWFMQACINDRRVILLSEADIQDLAEDNLNDLELASPEELEEKLYTMTKAELIKLIEDEGFDMPAKVNKANLVSSILSCVSFGHLEEVADDEEKGFGLP